MESIAGERLILVRHAMPEVDPEVRAEHWQLGPEGRAEARRHGPLVGGPAHYVASDEPKALQTAQEMAGPAVTVATDAGFAEVRRPHVWSDGDRYRDSARAYVRGECHDGWEPHDQVVARFDRAVLTHAAHAAEAGRTLVVGTHGLAPTIWMASRFTLDPSPAGFWEKLRFPDLVEVDLASGTVRTLRL